MIEDKLKEFFELWDSFWDSGLGGGPSFKELDKKARELKAEIGYHKSKKKSKKAEVHFEPEVPKKR